MLRAFFDAVDAVPSPILFGVGLTAVVVLLVVEHVLYARWSR